jgi:hypothetical protein
MPNIPTKKPILRDISKYDDLLEINKKLLRLAALRDGDPWAARSLMSDFIQTLDDLAGQRLYVMAGKGARMMDATILELFTRPDIAEAISELYFQNFQAPIRLVFSIATGPEGQLKTDEYSDELRDALVARGLENVIAHDGFRTDADHHLMELLIFNTLQFTGNHQSALDFCEAIMDSVNETSSGIDVIFLALRRLHPALANGSTPLEAIPLLQWMKLNEDRLVNQMVNSKPQPWMANELADIFHANELHGLGDRWYLRSGYLDFQRLYEIHLRSGLKPDGTYLHQFLADDVKLSLKQVRDLLKYSLTVENVIPEASSWKMKQAWVATSLVDAFNTFKKMGITPRSPDDCQALVSTLSEHLKSGETMKPLMTKQIQPYISGNNQFMSKMFSLDLGL